jgi:hypothetical protein
LLGDIGARGDEAEMRAAFESYERALALAEELKMRPLLARVHLGLGHLQARAGDRDKTLDHLGVALGLLREMDIRFWSARAAEELMELGHLFVVARHNVQLYDYLKQEFAGEAVTVIVDRRRVDGARAGAGATEGERRHRAETDEALNTRGFVVVPESQP